MEWVEKYGEEAPKKKTKFEKALKKVKVGDIVKVEGADGVYMENGKTVVGYVDSVDIGMRGPGNHPVYQEHWYYSKTTGKANGDRADLGRITAIQTRKAKWVKR